MESLPENYNALITYGRGKECKVEQLPLQQPGKNQILVKVAFAPLNPADIYTTLGAYPVPVPPPHAVGIEGSGTVVAVGEDLKVPHQVGDRVHIVSVGTYAQYILTASENCRKIKGDLSFETAASHYVNPATVACMGDIVRKGGHKTVVHTAGTSALGRMLIRYFKHKGIKTINIVRKDEYIDELKKDGADYVLNSQAPDFEKQFKEIAHKEEATIAFDAVAGGLTTQILKNQPKGSQCYIYGSLGGAKISDLYIQTFIFEGKVLAGLWLTEYLERAKKTGEDEKLFEEVYNLLPNVLNSNVQKVYKLEEWKQAIEYHKDNSSKGKILIQPN